MAFLNSTFSTEPSGKPIMELVESNFCPSPLAWRWPSSLSHHFVRPASLMLTPTVDCSVVAGTFAIGMVGLDKLRTPWAVHRPVRILFPATCPKVPFGGNCSQHYRQKRHPNVLWRIYHGQRLTPQQVAARKRAITARDRCLKTKDATALFYFAFLVFLWGRVKLIYH